MGRPGQQIPRRSAPSSGGGLGGMLAKMKANAKKEPGSATEEPGAGGTKEETEEDAAKEESASPRLGGGLLAKMGLKKP